MYQEVKYAIQVFESESLYYADSQRYYSLIATVVMLLLKFQQVEHAVLELLKLLVIQDDDVWRQKYMFEIEILLLIRDYDQTLYE